MAGRPDDQALEHHLKELEAKIAELETAEKTLRRRGERLSQIVQGSPIPTFVIDGLHVVTHCNKAFEKLKGIAAEDMIGTSNQWMTFYTSKRPVLADLIVDQASKEEIAALYEGKSRKSSVIDDGYEVEAFFPDLAERGMWLFFTASPLRDDKGHITGAIETLQDVTKRRNAEEALREGEKRLSQIVQGSSIPTLVIDNKHTITHCNRAFENLRGVSAEKIIGTHSDWLNSQKEKPILADFIVAEAPEVEMTWYYGGKCRKSPFVEGAYEAESFFPSWGDQGKWLYISAAPITDAEGNIVGAIETLQDVTKRRQTEEALREGKERLFQIVRGSSIPTFVIDTNHVITDCNQAFENLIGVTREKVIGSRKQWMAFYASERPVMADFVVDNLPGEKITRYYNGKCRKSEVIEGAYEAEAFFPDIGENGEWMFVTAAPLIDDEGHITGVIETLQNVTERKRAEEALRKSERRFRTLLDFVPFPLVVFDMAGRVSYLNPAFTETFGWSFPELDGKEIDYIPPGFEKEAAEITRRLSKEKTLLRLETKRITNHERLLDVSLSAAIYSEDEENPSGILAILSDITQEKRLARQNEAILRISMALPEYPDLEELLDYINSEIQRFLGCEGSIVVLRDEENDELFIPGASYDDRATQRRVKEIRFSMDQLVAGRVIQTGKPVSINDTSLEADLHRKRDDLLGYHTENLLVVPLKSSDRIIGALCAINKKHAHFEQTDAELLNMIGGTVALSVENARFSEEIKSAYREVSSMNRAKDKVINHLSHELRTPVSVLSGSLNILKRRLGKVPEKEWQSTMGRISRNLQRIVDIQYQAQDIMTSEGHEPHGLLSGLLDQCEDELETLIAEEIGEGPVIGKIRKRLDEIFGVKELSPKRIDLKAFIKDRLETLKPNFPHRQVELLTRLDTVPPILMPPEPLQKVVDGLLKNAVENTPDEGNIEAILRSNEEGIQFVVHDYGVGITVDNQARIFDGFFATQETMDYSSKRPFDFNAGGKGSDLLRMKIFSERYNFNIQMTSTRCGYIPEDTDICPGRISHCSYCKRKEDCLQSGETSFIITFSPLAEN